VLLHLLWFTKQNKEYLKRTVQPINSHDVSYQSGTISEEISDTLMLGDRAINRILILKLISRDNIRHIRLDFLDQPEEKENNLDLPSSNAYALSVTWKYQALRAEKSMHQVIFISIPFVCVRIFFI
jgi:hypothetical protein